MMRLRWLFAGLLVVLAGCGSDSSPPADGPLESQTAEDVVSTYARIVHQSYADSVEGAEALDGALEAFVDAPSEATLAAARDAWRASREPYLQTEVYRFYGGPIDDAETGPEGRLNAWPMDETYVDYVEDDATAGIVNDTTATLDADTLLGLNESDGETDIIVGFHPIEFMLWGQDLNVTPDAAGQRPFTDFVTGDGGTAANQDRRAAYLALLGDQLLADMDPLVTAWAPETAGNYRAGFESAPTHDAIGQILTGMFMLSNGELSGERLAVALNSGAQEDELSCFSDYTHRDTVGDALGIQNVYLGSYAALDAANDVEGAGIYDLVKLVDSALADELRDRIATSVMLAEGLRPTLADPAFDQLIAVDNAEGNAKVQALVDSLRTQGALILDVLDVLDITVEIPE
jgi:putative iron-regulated protein